MINSEEYLYIVDGDNQPLKPQTRSVAHSKGLWHRTTGIWVINRKGQILCQKRSFQKDQDAGLWSAFFGGHVESDQEYIQNALYECNEELGISVTKDELIPSKIFRNPDHKAFQQTFTLILNKDVDEFHFEKEEIDEIKWVNAKEVKENLADPEMTTWVKRSWDVEVIDWVENLLKA